jgi:phenylalanyl-tRNA synthetase beta chain
MKVPYSWIKEFIDIDIPVSDVVAKLNTTGIETTFHKFGQYIPNLTTVKVLSVIKHPEKDKLYICKVSDGSREYQIITGADNVKENDVVILAKVGAVIKCREIKPVSFGSYTSEGMLLSLEELEVEEKSEGIFILDENTPVGADPNKILGLGEDYILEIEITPNRGDALSVRGLAREIGAIFNLKRKEIQPKPVLTDKETPVNIETDKVYRYIGTIIKNVKIKNSPLDVRLKLIKSGISVINNIVDITNYVLLQEGQPLHAFDLDKLEGGITVRYAKEGEKIITLDGQEKELKPTDVVIADSKKALAIAGVIGGENSKIDENTKNILLEAAVFDPASVRKTSKRLGILTDSSYRFERGVDVEHTSKASNFATQLILNLAGGEVETYKDVYVKPYTPKTVILKPEFVEKVLGEKIDASEIKSILERLEIPTQIQENQINAEIPPFRAYDLERPIDLVEEVARIYGYDNFTPTYPRVPVEAYEKSLYYDFDNKVRTYFLDNGFTEVLNYTFTSEEIYNTLKLPIPEVKITNYILKSHSILRDRIVVSLLENLKENLRFGRKNLSIFELSSTFFNDFKEIRVGCLAVGKLVDGFNYTEKERKFSTTHSWNFLKLKGVAENLLNKLGIKNYQLIDENIEVFLHPYESANIQVNGYDIGFIGKIHPEIAHKLEIPKDTYVAELKLRYVPREIEKENLLDGYLYTYYLKKEPVVFQELPKFPSAYRDLAFVIEESVKVGKLKEDILKASKYVKEVKLFDVYFLSENKKSVAFNVEFFNPEKSLSDEEVSIIVEEILNKLKLNYPDISLRT